MERSQDYEKLTVKKAKRMIRKIDRERARYYDFYAGQTWGDKSNYDLCINTSNTEIKKIVPIIAKMFK
jgi:cytidylate kinase